MHLSSVRKSKFFDLLNTSTFLCQNTPVLLACFLLVGTLNACSPFSETPETEPTAEVTIHQDSQQKALSVPPINGQRPLKPGETATATMPNGLPALQPLKGVNVDQLFSENISDSDKRFERVETAVLDMRREFEAVKPAIVRLVAVEADIEQLVQQLEVMMQEDSLAPSSGAGLPPVSDLAPQNVAPVQSEAIAPAALVSSDQAAQPPDPQMGAPIPLSPAAPSPATIPSHPSPATTPPATTVSAAPMPAQTGTAPAPAPAASLSSADPPDIPASPPVPAAGQAVAKGLRLGFHDGFTRVVIDANAQTPHRTDLDAQENILVIELPQALWTGPKTQAFGPSSLISSYTVESLNNGQGSRIIMVLARKASVMKDQILPPGGNPDFRILIDLKPR